MLTAPVIDVRELGELGTTCAVTVELTFSGRTAWVQSVWHYAHADDAPRLVTAYPTT